MINLGEVALVYVNLLLRLQVKRPLIYMISVDFWVADLNTRHN